MLIDPNDIGGMHEQINDGIDGVLVDLNNLDDASEKIKKYFNNQQIFIKKLANNNYNYN